MDPGSLGEFNQLMKFFLSPREEQDSFDGIFSPPVSQFDKLVCLSQGSLEELKVWSSTDVSEGLPFTIPSTASSLYTDASDLGIGIYFQGEMISENLPSWCRNAHINIKVWRRSGGRRS